MSNLDSFKLNFKISKEVQRRTHPTQSLIGSYIKYALLYDACPESKCTEALTAGGIFFLICCLHCHVAWFLPSATRPVWG